MKKFSFLLTLIISFNAYSMELDDLVRDLLRQMYQKPQEQTKKEIVIAKAISEKTTANIDLPFHQQVMVLSDEQLALLYAELLSNPEEYDQKIAVNRERLMKQAEQKIAENNSMHPGLKVLLGATAVAGIALDIALVGYGYYMKCSSSVLNPSYWITLGISTVITIPYAWLGSQKLWREHSKAQAKKQHKRILNALKQVQN